MRGTALNHQDDLSWFARARLEYTEQGRAVKVGSRYFTPTVQYVVFHLFSFFDQDLFSFADPGLHPWLTFGRGAKRQFGERRECT